jgi:hypothetical protein
MLQPKPKLPIDKPVELLSIRPCLKHHDATTLMVTLQRHLKRLQVIRELQIGSVHSFSADLNLSKCFECRERMVAFADSATPESLIIEWEKPMNPGTWRLFRQGNRRHCRIIRRQA